MSTDSAHYWVIENADLADMLHRAAAGEDPDLLLVEEYANSDHDYIEGDDD